jgi:hypothetical protein
MLGSVHASTTYGMWGIKSKTQAIATDNTCYVLTQLNLTSRNPNSPDYFKLHNRLYYRKHNGIAQFYYEHVSQRCVEAKSVSI